MSALSLSALDSKIESVAAGVLKHIGQSVDLKGRIEKLEGDAKVDFAPLKAEVIAEVKSMLSELRSEIMGEVMAAESDSVGLVGKAMDDLTAPSAEAPEAPKADAPAEQPAPAPAAPVIPMAITGA